MNQEDWDRINEFAALSLADLCAISLGFERRESGSLVGVSREWNRRITVAMNHIDAGSLQTLEKCSGPTYGHAILPGNENSLNIFLNTQVFMKWAIGLGWNMPIEFTGNKSKAMKCEQYYSKNLQLLLEAAERFWKNADPGERDTYEQNDVVSEWLQGKGLSKHQADVGASIIRPEWAEKGRTPGKNG